MYAQIYPNNTHNNIRVFVYEISEMCSSVFNINYTPLRNIFSWPKRFAKRFNKNIVCFGFRSNALIVCICVITDKYYDIKTLDLFKRICHEQTLFRGVFRFLTFCHDYFLSGFEKIKSFG